MRYAGMPAGMWILFAGSFRRSLSGVFGLDTATAARVTGAAGRRYREIIAQLPEFEKGDRFRMNIVSCAMLSAFLLNLPERPKVDQATDASRDYIHRIIQKENGHALVVESVHQPKGFIRFEEWANNIASPGVDVAEMRGKRVMAVSAIGNPASFEQTLSDIGAVVIESLRFPDHHDYTVQEMLDVAAQAQLLDAEAIVITEKDAVKVPAELLRERADFKIPIYVVSVEVTFRDGEEDFIHLMKQSLKDKMKRNERLSA